MKTDKVIFHIDANSAFLSWSAAERLKNGDTLDIRKIPAVVGGQVHSRKGIVLAASMPAKELGIKTGEPLYLALRKCKGLHIEPPDFNIYEKYSKEMYTLCSYFSPDLMKFSIDELFLNYSGLERFWGSPEKGAELIKNTIYEKLGFTVNIGISVNKLLAKTASDFQKPNRVHTLYPNEIKEKYWPLPVGDMFMVGRSTKEKLLRMGITTVGQLAKTDISVLRYHFKTFGIQLYQFANGIATDVFTPIELPKSVGNGITTQKDLITQKDIERLALALTQKCVHSLRKQKLTCELVEVSLRKSDFLTYSHRIKTDVPLDDYKSIFTYVKKVIKNMWQGEPVRAVTVRLCKLEIDAIIQYTFFNSDTFDHNRRIQAAIDKIRDRFGYDSITCACLLKDNLAKSVPRKQPLDISSRL